MRHRTVSLRQHRVATTACVDAKLCSSVSGSVVQSRAMRTLQSLRHWSNSHNSLLTTDAYTDVVLTPSLPSLPVNQNFPNFPVHSSAPFQSRRLSKPVTSFPIHISDITESNILKTYFRIAHASRLLSCLEWLRGYPGSSPSVVLSTYSRDLHI